MVDEIVFLQFLPHLHSVNLEDAAIVSLHQYADGVSSKRLGQHPRRGANTPFKANADGAGASSYVALLYWSAVSVFDGIYHHLRGNVHLPYLIEAAVVSLAHNGIH